jgi:uridine kinase
MTFDRDNIVINVEGLGEYHLPVGSTAEELADKVKDQVKAPVMAIAIDNDLKDLHHVFTDSCRVKLITLDTEQGLRIYRSSAVFILLQAVREVFPDRKLIVRHSLSNGLFCEFLHHEPERDDVEKLERCMQDLVQRDLPIRRKAVTSGEALEIFARQKQTDKVKLLEFRDKEIVHVCELGSWYEYSYGYMVPRTGMINNFRLLHYPPGIILQTPEADRPWEIKPYIEQKKLAAVFKEAKDWADMLETPHVAALNEMIASQRIDDLIRVNEALHEKKIASIADMICHDPHKRLILISGPSSSGKTTFAQRLLIQLRVNGRRPVSISLDNYFIDRDQTPLDENGEYDFESLYALKLDLFNDHLQRLIAGEEVLTPIYSFQKGCCEEQGLLIKVPAGEPIIIEGIHALNEKLTSKIPYEQKFRIYVSALTQLNIDYTNRIPTTDSRLLRRIIRDSRTRGYGALQTIRRWPSVRAGEEKNIFPFQEHADVMFNTSLVYELAVLKAYAEPLLEEIGPENPEYMEARRLLKFLSYFCSTSGDIIPPNSILREFIGGSWFKS